jgi:hypothetical protein
VAWPRYETKRIVVVRLELKVNRPKSPDLFASEEALNTSNGLFMERSQFRLFTVVVLKQGRRQ